MRENVKEHQWLHIWIFKHSLGWSILYRERVAKFGNFPWFGSLCVMKISSYN